MLKIVQSDSVGVHSICLSCLCVDCVIVLLMCRNVCVLLFCKVLTVVYDI